MQTKHLALVALFVISSSAFAGKTVGTVSGEAKAHAATAPNTIGGSYSYASGVGAGTVGAGSFEVSSSGVAWNQSWGGGTGRASSIGQASVAFGNPCDDVSAAGSAAHSIAARANQGITAAAVATGSATSVKGNAARAMYTADALATKGLVTVDGVELAAGTGTSVADAIARAFARIEE